MNLAYLPSNPCMNLCSAIPMLPYFHLPHNCMQTLSPPNDIIHSPQPFLSKIQCGLEVKWIAGGLAVPNIDTMPTSAARINFCWHSRIRRGKWQFRGDRGRHCVEGWDDESTATAWWT